MKKAIVPLALLCLAILLISSWRSDDTSAVSHISSDGQSDMVQAARGLLASLEEDQLKKATFTFDDQERSNWFFVPIYRQRKGLSLEEMDGAQRKKTNALLKTTLSNDGFDKVQGIMGLESVLRAIENADHRNPDLYYVSIFGTPSVEEPWGWRYEGHHLSLNFTSATGEIAVTPAFMGTNPGKVLSGPKKGTQVLKQEEELARAFVKSLSGEQRAKAVISEKVPADIFTGNDRNVEAMALEGLSHGDLNEAQRADLLELLDVYLGNMQSSIADKQWNQIKTTGLDRLHFAWIGGTEFMEPHYYRIQGPTILIEYDNIQNGANHVHSVWRDLQNDWGEDLLKKHYQDNH